jgi:hypothetical protein
MPHHAEVPQEERVASQLHQHLNPIPSNEFAGDRGT